MLRPFKRLLDRLASQTGEGVRLRATLDWLNFITAG